MHDARKSDELPEEVEVLVGELKAGGHGTRLALLKRMQHSAERDRETAQSFAQSVPLLEQLVRHALSRDPSTRLQALELLR